MDQILSHCPSKGGYVSLGHINITRIAARVVFVKMAYSSLPLIVDKEERGLVEGQFDLYIASEGR